MGRGRFGWRADAKRCIGEDCGGGYNKYFEMGGRFRNEDFF